MMGSNAPHQFCLRLPPRSEPRSRSGCRRPPAPERRVKFDRPFTERSDTDLLYWRDRYMVASRQVFHLAAFCRQRGWVRSITRKQIGAHESPTTTKAA